MYEKLRKMLPVTTKFISTLCFSLQACGSRGKALLEKAIRNNVSQCSPNMIYLFASIADILTDVIMPTWCCLAGKTAEEQCFDQRPIMGSEDFICGWYPFDSSGNKRDLMQTLIWLVCVHICSEPLLTADGTMWMLMFRSVPLCLADTRWRNLLLTNREMSRS